MSESKELLTVVLQAHVSVLKSHTVEFDKNVMEFQMESLFTVGFG